MLNKVLAISAASLCGFLGAATLSQSASAAVTTSKAIIGQYDKDSDHTLDLNEAKAAASDHFAKLDKDSDGTLDSAELKGVVGKTTLKAVDTDNDGTLTKDEYLSLVEKAFNKADVDHDGTVSAKELGSPKGHELKHLID